MVQKYPPAPAPRKRGRPRAFDPDVALAKAMETFWTAGYAGTSLDDLSAATGMNRPSLYAAFGDKKALYEKAYAHYRTASRAAMGDAFTRDCSLRDRLRLIFSRALDLYLSGDGARGCFSVVTAASEAVGDPDVARLVVGSIEDLDRVFASLFTQGVATGELSGTANVQQLAQLATATLHTLSVRSRAGFPRDRLEAVIEAAVGTIMGPADPAPGLR